MDPPQLYMRDPRLVVVTGRSDVLLVNGSGATLRLGTRDPHRWSELMQRLIDPVPEPAVLDLGASLPELDGAMWERLIVEGYVQRSADEMSLIRARDRIFVDNRGFHLQPREPACGHLVLACTGSIVSGLMTPTILSLLYSRFQHQLDVIVTESAQRFLPRDLLESYGVRTWCDPFERKDGLNVAHVQLAREADCVVVLPASANALHRIATGACTDLLSLVACATTAPVVVSPVMNGVMWNSRSVQRNVHQLREDGVHVIEPTLIFGAADVASQGGAMYGGHGTLWSGPSALFDLLSAIVTGEPARQDPVPHDPAPSPASE